MSLTSDRGLFEFIEKNGLDEKSIEQIITESVKIKKSVVEKDECEGGIRKILNFGHTLGHGIEAEEDMNGLYHGECVALGMIPVCGESVRKRLIPLLKKVGLPYKYEGDLNSALEFISHDKKCDGSLISVIFVDEIGSYRIEKMDVSTFTDYVIKENN